MQVHLSEERPTLYCGADTVSAAQALTRQINPNIRRI